MRSAASKETTNPHEWITEATQRKLLSPNTETRINEGSEFFLSRRRTRKNAEIENHEIHEKTSCLNPTDWCPPGQSVPAVSGKPCGFPYRRSVLPDAAHSRRLGFRVWHFCPFWGEYFRLPPLSHLSHSSQLSHENAFHGTSMHGNAFLSPPLGVNVEFNQYFDVNCGENVCGSIHKVAKYRKLTTALYYCNGVSEDLTAVMPIDDGWWCHED